MGKPSNTEVRFVVLLFALFVAVNLLTATRFPVPWYDEIQFVDPAANLYFSDKFTTTAYGWERGTDLHAHHPLYSLLLAGWFEITGFGLVRARAFNYALIILTVLVVWFTVARTGLVPSATYRTFLVLLLLFGYSISFPYRAGRIEPLLMLLSALSFLLFTIENRCLRIGLLAGLTLLFAPAGLHLVVFAGVFTLLVAVYLGRHVLLEVTVIWFSLLISVSGLFAFYAMHGVLDNALNAVVPHATTGGVGTLFSGGTLNHVNKLPKDPSLVVLIGLLGFLLIDQIRRGRFRYRSMLSFGAATCISVPTALLTSAKFPTYYSWMVFIPLSVCLCSALAAINPRGLKSLGMRAGLVLGCLMGLPLQLLAISYDWHDRDYGVVQEIVRDHVGIADWVLTDYQTYFAVKPKAAEVFLPDYVRLLTAEEKRKLTLLIGSDGAVAKWRSIVGGEWDLAAQGFAPVQSTILQRLTGRNVDVGLIGKKYRFTIYRRQA